MVYTQLMCTKEKHTAMSVLPENTGGYRNVQDKLCKIKERK